MAFPDTWLAVWDELVAETKKVTDFDNKVYWGEKTIPEFAPSAYVIPGPIDIRPATNVDNFYIMAFIIEILVRDPDLKLGFKTAVELAAKVHDEIKNDRSLGGLVDKTEMKVVPNVKKSQLENAWTDLQVVCTYMGT